MLGDKPHLKVDQLGESDRRKVAEFVESYAGIQCPASKHSLVESRLRKRQRVLGFNTLKDYIRFALDEPEGKSERHNLLDAITTNKTDFYREQEHFTYLKQYLKDRICNGRLRHGPLRIWSAGCSSGEEPYTLAIELLELQREIPEVRFTIIATDISQSCLAKAKRAIYAHERIEPLPLALRQRYLLKSRDSDKKLVQIAPEVRQHVNFGAFNLLQSDYRQQGQFDVIFCRNVMIYFNNTDRAAITRQFAGCLRMGGLLILGHSESLVGNHDVFTRERPTVYRRERPPQ